MISRHLELFLRFFLILGSLHYLLLGVSKVNVFDYIRNPTILRFVYVFFGVVALYFMFQRDFFLPFLGETVMPTAIEQNKENAQDVTLTGLPPNVTVIAWAANENTPKDMPFKNPWVAYGDFSNYDEVQSDDKGEAVVSLTIPSGYDVGKKELKSHVHYRYQLPEKKGIFSRVHTHFLNKK